MPTALITGAGGGLGKALAHQFAVNGYDLILHTRNSPLPIINGVRIYDVHGDLNDTDVYKRLIDNAKRCEVDVVILNAAEYLNKSFSEMSELDLVSVLRTNLLLPACLLHGLWPIFERNRQGTIININSLAGQTGAKGETAYAASKHGLCGLMSSLQFDATRINVQVTDVFLGAMNTPMNEDSGNLDKKMDPVEVAKIIVGLCDEKATLRIPEITIARKLY